MTATFRHRGLPVRVTTSVREGSVFQLSGPDGRLIVAPLTAWSLQHEGRCRAPLSEEDFE